jgi:hypothetical protein
MVGPHGVAARQYFLSLEPLLEDIASVVEAVLIEASIRRLKVWVVPGGESGPDARVCRVEWIEKVKDVCLAYGCPVFVKQLGRNAMEAWSLVQRWPAGTTFNSFGNLCPPDYRIVCLGHPKGGDPGEWPAALRVRQEPLTDWEKDEVPL